MNGTSEAAQRVKVTKMGGEEKRIGRFRLLSRLGEGGMGAVYAARDTEAPGIKLVALKTTKQQGVEAERLLYDEAEIASRIDHPNVCRVHEVGREGDLLYLVLDYCDGASLHELLQTAEAGRLPSPLAVKIAALVAAGLHAAHELIGEGGAALEVIHRDVSPQNVLISLDGQVSVTDFGVAKARGQAHSATETGEVKGKASYMAPEQVRSRDVDRRADVFALGCVLYQCLLGRRPFQGETTVSTLYQILEEPIPLPKEVDSEFPEGLEPVLMKALAKDREERFSSAEEFQIALETWLVEQGLLITELEIGECLNSLLGAAPLKKKQKILALAQSPTSPSVSVAAPDEEQADSTPPATAFQERAVSQQKSWSPLLPALALVALGALYWSFQGASEDVVPPPPRGDVTVTLPPAVPESSADEKNRGLSETAAEKPAPAELVALIVKATPADAVISVDGVELGVGALEHQLVASSQLHKIQVKKSGYIAVERLVVVESDTRLLMDLKEIHPRPKSRPVASPSVAPVPKKRPAKPKRSLDSENPFAQ